MTVTPVQPILQRLREHATLGGAPLNELQWLAANGYLRRYAAGETAIRQGQAPGLNGLMVLFTGHVVLYVDRAATGWSGDAGEGPLTRTAPPTRRGPTSPTRGEVKRRVTHKGASEAVPYARRRR